MHLNADNLACHVSCELFYDLLLCGLTGSVIYALLLYSLHILFWSRETIFWSANSFGRHIAFTVTVAPMCHQLLYQILSLCTKNILYYKYSDQKYSVPNYSVPKISCTKNILYQKYCPSVPPVMKTLPAWVTAHASARPLVSGSSCRYLV